MFNKQSGYFQSGVSVVGNLAATGISAVALIIITRLLGPEKFGVFSVGLSISLILIKVNELGLNIGLVKLASKNDSQSERNLIYSLCLKYKLLITLVIAVIGVLVSPVIAQILNFPQPLIIALACTIGLSTVYYEFLVSILQSLHRFTEAVIANAVQASIKLLGAFALFAFGVNAVWPIFSIFLLAPIIPFAFVPWLLPSWLKIKLRTQSSKIATQLFKVAKHSSVAIICAGIIENVDVLFVQKYLSTYEAGLYSGVSRIALIFAVIAYGLGNVLNARVAKYHDRQHLQPYIRKSFWVVLGSVLGFLVFIPFSSLAIYYTIGPQFMAGNEILLILTAASFLTIAAMPFLALFFSFDSNWYFSTSGIIQLLIVVLGNFIFVPLFGLEGAAWVRFSSRLFLFAFTTILGLYFYKRLYAQKT